MATSSDDPSCSSGSVSVYTKCSSAANTGALMSSRCTTWYNQDEGASGVHCMIRRRRRWSWRY
jgi:hypothetical protein